MSCGGSMKKMKTGGVNKKLFKGKETYKEELAEGKAIKSGKISPKQYASGEESEKKMKKMAVGGTTTKRIIKKSTGGMYGIPQENLGTSGQYGFAKKGGSTGTHKMPNGKVMLNSKMQKGGITGTELKRRGQVNKSIGIEAKLNGQSMKSIGQAMKAAGKRKKSEGTYEKNNGTYTSPAGRTKYKTGGATKATKFAALAPPYDKATFADKIVGAKKSAGSKKLPKAQLGAIVKGVSKFFGPAIGATGKSSKIIKPATKAVKLNKNTSRIPGVADNAKFMAKNIGAGALLAAPVYAGLVGAVNYDKTQANKKKFTNTKGTETTVHKGKDGKKYVKVNTRDGKTYNKTIK